MALRFYNTMSGEKEVFKPLRRGAVHIYNCGPTVYDYAHIGNLRAYVFADILRRYLEYRGFMVRQVMNITDVGHMTMDEETEGRGEDKIEMKARKEKKDPWEISKFYEKAFYEDIAKLNIKRAMTYPRATEHIKEMIKTIQRLIKKGYAYEANGSVYYDITKFKDYGRLSGNTIEKLEAGKRIDVVREKRNWFDFALWKKDPKHIMQWDSPWGRGFPGWHIECSVMSMKYLGDTLDIHTGGEDNIFPHHECEIAQAEGATGKKFVRYWLHTRHLLVNGEKMSKSKGNFYTLRDLLKKGYDPKAIRYLLLSGHYRIRLNFTEKGLRSAEETVKRLQDFVSNLRGIRETRKRNPNVKKLVQKVKGNFEKAMDDDLNVALALGRVFDFVRDINRLAAEGIGKDDARLVYDILLEFDKVLGLELEKLKIEKPSREIEKLIKKREGFRKGKNWKEADKIRDRLRKMGYILEDTETGVKVKKA
jgi:cysteinyl-tRNA synthetase